MGAMQAAIVYLHGFRSSPASVKARALVAAIEALPPSDRPLLHVPMLDGEPLAAIADTAAWIEANVISPPSTLTLVGSSLGGYYATHLAERYRSRAVLINPAIHPARDLAAYLGPQTNLYTGATFIVTPTHFAALEALAVDRIAQPERYWLMVQTADEVLNYREAIAFYAGSYQLVEGGGDHAFMGFERQITAILRFAGVRTSTTR